MRRSRAKKFCNVGTNCYNNFADVFYVMTGAVLAHHVEWRKNMTLLEICILCSITIVLLGNLFYTLILVQRRFHKSKFYIRQENGKPYISDLQRIIKKTNGWLYLLILFNCIQYSFGPWSIIFSMLCFLTSTSGKSDLSAFCSVFATISSSIMLFCNPSKKYEITNHAWRNATSRLEAFLIHLPTYTCTNDLKTKLAKLSKDISDISNNSDI